MLAKYEPLTQALADAKHRGQETVELGFDVIADLVGGLPPSADRRQWWANSSHTQAHAWRSAGYHVENVDLDERRVQFVLGKRGASRDDGEARRPPDSKIQRAPVEEPGVDVHVHMRWLAADNVTLDSAGKPAFGPLEAGPGLYRMTLTGGVIGGRPRVYIGETDSLHRRLAGNYRNPGGTQQTSLRINALLREHLTAQGTVQLAVATTVTVWLVGAEQRLDLTRKAARLLAENAALVLARAVEDVEIVNLG